MYRQGFMHLYDIHMSVAILAQVSNMRLLPQTPKRRVGARLKYLLSLDERRDVDSEDEYHVQTPKKHRSFLRDLRIVTGNAEFLETAKLLEAGSSGAVSRNLAFADCSWGAMEVAGTFLCNGRPRIAAEEQWK